MWFCKSPEATLVRTIEEDHSARTIEENHSALFWFIPVDKFMDLPENDPIPRHQELRHTGMLVQRKVSMNDVVSGTLAKDTAAVSHRWPAAFHFDPDGKKMKKLKFAFSMLPSVKYIWLDWICAPQKVQKQDADGSVIVVTERTLEEKQEFDYILGKVLQYIYLGAKVVIIWDREYNRRFWPNVETFVAMKSPTFQGVKPARRDGLRAEFFGFLSADGEDDVVRESLMGHWHKCSIQDAINKLSHDDVMVTNLKDKQTNLKVLASLDNILSEVFASLAPELDGEDKAYVSAQETLLREQEQAENEDDFDRAQEIEDQILSAKEKYMKSLTAKKKDAIRHKNYTEAKRLTARIKSCEDGSDLVVGTPATDLASAPAAEAPPSPKVQEEAGPPEERAPPNSGVAVECVNLESGKKEAGKDMEADCGLMASLHEKNIIEILNDSGIGDRKMSIGSTLCLGKTSFENKATEMLGDKLDPTSIGLGFTCRKGLKPESPNQDSLSVLWIEGEKQNCSIYAVMDGHGKKGHEISNFVKENLPKLIVKDRRFMTPAMPEMLKDCFKEMQSLISTLDRTKKLNAQLAGTTCTIVVHDHNSNKITVAHVGHSQCVLGKADKSDMTLALAHKPNRPEEKRRIESQGGRVVFDGYANHRVYAKTGRYPGLNMSRSLGDLLGNQDCGISSEPEVSVHELTAQDSTLLLCTDGVWEFISPQEAVEIVSAFRPNQAMDAVDKLAKESWDRWIREEEGSVVDNITIVLVFLKEAGRKVANNRGEGR